MLSCAEVNAAGRTSVAGSASVSIAPLPAPPAIKAAASMAPGSTGTASVTARAGMTYAWAVTSGSTTAPAGVTDSGTNTLTFTAATSGAVGLSCVETNAAGKSSAAATASVPIVSQSTLTVGGTGSGAGTMTSTGLSPELNCSWSGNATSGICAGTVLAGASVTLFTTASSGSRFVTWSNGCNTPTCSVTPNADLTLTATFVAQTTVTVTLAGTGSASGTVVSSPAGINCGPACSAGFDVTAIGVISLTASGGSSATFSAFSGDCSGATCMLPSDGLAKSVTATFTGLNIWAGKKAAPAGNAAACSGVIDGILYSAEGYSAPGTTRAYHPADDSWTTGAAPSAAQASVYSAGGVIGGLLYCAGGCSTSSDCRVNPSSLLVAYDPKGDIWTTRASMPAAHALISVVGIGGLLYRVGGIGACPPCTPTTSVEAYDPATNAWTAKAPLPVARAQQTLVALGGLLYSIGGSIDWSSTTDTATADLLVFDPAAPTATAWSQLASMGSTRLNPTCDALGGKIYCAGGYNGLPGTYPAPTEMYDPQTKLWTTLPNLPTPRTQAAGGTIGGLFYVVGGNNAAGLSSAVEVYTP